LAKAIVNAFVINPRPKSWVIKTQHAGFSQSKQPFAIIDAISTNNEAIVTQSRTACPESSSDSGYETIKTIAGI